MADEEDPWGFDNSEQPENAKVEESEVKAATPIPVSVNTDLTTDTELQTEVQDDIEIDEKSLPQIPEDDGYRKPVQLYRHWVRPKFLQYKYMYNYRTNYYDDVIDYLDKKMVGVSRDIPRPQTWAERVLRSNYCSSREMDSYSSANKQDRHLIQTLAASIRTYNYHTKAYINQKYAHVL